jgi:hypothetical protein
MYTDALGARPSTTLPDISASLIGSLRGKDPNPDDINRLNGDACVVLIAVKALAEVSLLAIFYLLARHTDEMEKLRRERKPYRDAGHFTSGFLHSEIAQLPHLNGVIIAPSQALCRERRHGMASLSRGCASPAISRFTVRSG